MKTNSALSNPFPWFLIFALVLLAVSLFGCKSTAPEPQIVYKDVLVPVACDQERLPTPPPVDCGEPAEGDWRASAGYIKECFDKLVQKIEEYHHIIVSYNETVE
jgi:hypothetical protein